EVPGFEAAQPADLLREPLVMWPKDWEGSAVRTVAEWLVRSYSEIPRWDAIDADPNGVWDSFYTPYQFTLVLMQSLYHSIVGTPADLLVKPVEIEDMEADRRSNKPIRIIGRNPHPRGVAIKQQLLAIAYYSW